MTEVSLRLRSFQPVIAPPALPETDVAYVEHDSPVGRLLLAATRQGVVTCSYGAPEQTLARLSRAVSPRILRGGERLDGLRRELDEYFTGRLRRFTVPVDLSLTGRFQREVIAALERVDYGSRTTYGGLAMDVGAPRSSRAVGTALGANPVCILRPCHRVVRVDGSLSGYAGGVAAKAWLLDLESCHRQP